MSQPLRLKDKQYMNHVCKLHKSIYGLRQAPRAWHDALKAFTTSHGFTTSKSDPFFSYMPLVLSLPTSWYMLMIFF